MYKNFFKRILDFFIAIIMLTLLSPIFILLTVLLYIFNDGQVFFLQKRPGKNERIFSIIKFKTMNDKKDAEGQLLPDGDRLTPVGKIVRKTSMDEIPQLINILKGDMSLIGPRPLLIQYLSVYNEREKRRHSVLPGITGLSQVSGRNNLGWDVRLNMDVEYVENMSFLLDLKIFFKTIKNVITSKDVAVDSFTVMPTLDEYRRNT
ncbi:sugar transferase [Arenibacter sp. BSSL-BM3]|uniref:Sugar transferase n=1 Tax=Arenibacter arenosicollis TaxID=2762274 RepID=A0ABR7QKZ5_9FLAO|nr:sugar transferase [Arenibacter arenosicollis]MBC8767862.1 sugar transferase [Arenibacter arenosicollis]